MKKLFGPLLLIFLLISCGDKKESLVEEIRNMEKTDSLESYENVQRYNELLTTYIKTYPDDELSKEFLYKAAQSCAGIDKHYQAIEYFKTYIDKYPKEEKAGSALFTTAFIFENKLNQKDSALKYYEDFIVMYPSHPLVESAKMSIVYMETPIEDLVKQFENQKDNSDKSVDSGQ